MKRTYILALTLLVAICAFSVTLNDAKALYNNEEYDKALQAFKELLAKNSKSAKDANLNNYVGLCLYNLGEYDLSIPYFTLAESKSVPDASKHLALIAFNNYEFEDALDHIETYQESLSKAKKEMPQEFEAFISRAVNARNMLDRVENIQIIDSINVNAESFFKFYKISQECGSINATDILPNGFEAAPYSIVYQPESKAQMIWPTLNADMKETLVSSSILSDNSWEQPQELDETINNGNSNYPYMMPDGITLYFANDGENSIGGYDIFFTRKDDDGFLQPQNMGMPYNSLHNDFMLVIDEMTGLGWWATDRNQIDGQVTIYTFIPSEIRKNYPTDTPNLINLAKINAISDTWLDDNNYTEILNNLSDINKFESTNHSNQFSLTLPNGKIYTSITDFQYEEAVQAMQEYLDELNTLNNLIQQVSQLRIDYSNGLKEIAPEIRILEQKILTQRLSLTRLRNMVVSLECK
ncbi:MAG: tetratricopeptide repeat protein [Muribaculaceae bacterium]|nr:tetratricopeptide repeat protein [Muribaculaceae bacterium]